MSQYVIFGCGSIGNAIVCSLSQDGSRIFVVDKNEDALRSVEKPGVQVMIGDMQSLDLDIPQITEASTIAILTSDLQVNLGTLKRVKKEFADKFVLLVSDNINDSKELYDNGANAVVRTDDIVSNAAVLELQNAELKRSAFMLGNVIKSVNKKGWAILLQDNPDPDAIASGLALKVICREFDVECEVYYGGTISHQQNKALVNMLNVDMTQLRSVDEVRLMIETSDKIALIEASVATKNNVLPEGFVPNIVIDHHQTDFEIDGEFVDIRPKVGSVSTIMTGYLRQLDIEIDSFLATALRYGIRIDTLGFTRNTTIDDLNAAAFLSPLIDMGLLSQIENPPMSLETMDIIGRAILNKEIKGSYMLSFVAFIEDRDALPQAAELMLQLEGVYTVLVFGILKDKIQLSARSIDTRVNLGSLLQKAFGNMNAGGHQNMAGGAIDLGIFGDVTDKKALIKVIYDAVRKKFFSVVGVRFEDDVTVDTDINNN
ncbi:MAG: DHH family phosphoesterase [Candidatus Anammoxibacter sp.]